MNPPRVLSLAGLAVAATLLWLTLDQQSRLAALRADADALRAGLVAREAGTSGRSNIAAPVDALTEVEKLELMRLRAEVARLRRLKDELASVRSEHDRLTAQVAERNDRPRQLPAGFVSREDTRLVGAATPEAAVQSFLWASLRHDTNLISQFLDDASTERLRKDIERHGGAEAFWNSELDRVAGFRILSQETLDADSVRLKVQFDTEDSSGQEIVAQRAGGAWRLHFPE